jgi:hypothetical protein
VVVGGVVGAANACPFLSSTRRRPNALSRDRHDSVMHRSSTLRGAPQLHHVKRRIANCLSCTSRMFHFLSAFEFAMALSFVLSFSSPTTSMRLFTSFAAPTRRLYASSVLQRRQFHATQCLKDAARPSEAEVDRARAYCANLVRLFTPHRPYVAVLMR